VPEAVARRALFTDRDGTIIEERGYLADPSGVAFLPGAVEGLASFQAAGFSVVIVTNQSGIARGYYNEAAYGAVQAAVVGALAERGVTVLASYHCPHHPAHNGPCDCRKPAAGLFRRAALDHGLQLSGSVWVGDRLRDVEPARELGGQGVLVRTGYGAAESVRAPDWVVVVEDLRAAASTIIAPAEER
jgi:D-glycero-D-manno-heptose 1,7-bisphosphate phosphatase